MNLYVGELNDLKLLDKVDSFVNLFTLRSQSGAHHTSNWRLSNAALLFSLSFYEEWFTSHWWIMWAVGTDGKVDESTFPAMLHSGSTSLNSQDVHSQRRIRPTTKPQGKAGCQMKISSVLEKERATIRTGTWIYTNDRRSADVPNFNSLRF